MVLLDKNQFTIGFKQMGSADVLNKFDFHVRFKRRLDLLFVPVRDVVDTCFA
jgi:hypothetical protein